MIMAKQLKQLDILPITLATEKKKIELDGDVDLFKSIHIFDEPSIHAVNAALASGRPLLVRGEPGVGKTQLARAVAKELNKVFLSYTVDIQTEAKDLLWKFDYVERLAKAQVAGAIAGSDGQWQDIEQKLAISQFLHPGPLWWGFNWKTALERAHNSKATIPDHVPGAEKNGCVILIDEIDKAETDVPNGLLEALGAAQFTPVGEQTPIFAKRPFPLVIITTNEERALPNAFLRRCMVLDMTLPREEGKLSKTLMERGSKHFPDITPNILKMAVEMLIEDRKTAQSEKLNPVPGQAEYLDLLRAIHQLRPGMPKEQEDILIEIRNFALRKHGPKENQDEE